MEVKVPHLIEGGQHGDLETTENGRIVLNVIASNMDDTCDENVDVMPNFCDSNGNGEDVVDDSSEDQTFSCSDNGSESIPDLSTLVEDDVKFGPDISVPTICVHAAVGEQQNPRDEEQGNEEIENETYKENIDDKKDVAVNDNTENPVDQAQCISNDLSLPNHDHIADDKDSQDSLNEAQAPELSKASDKLTEDEEVHDASNQKSKFSFFRSIQNIMIATKWSKLRHHGSPKLSKGQGHSNNLQVEDRSHKSDRQRKISQKSLPGDLRKKSREDEHNGCHDDQFKSQEFNREGLEYLDSPSGGHSKNKGHSKGHFSFFKRHNVETPPSSPPPTPPPDLTEEQKTLLRASWDEIRGNIGQVGVIAFIGLFETHPDAKDTFVQFRGMSLESVFNSISLKEHALRVMTTVEKFINRIDRPDKLKTLLEDLGRRHVTYKFNSHYINAVGMQFVFAMRPHVSQWTPETEKAWSALIDVMTYHMKQGTHLESEPEQSEQQQSSC